ncbi:MAG TPA: SCO1664 family protein [Dehalococcoidia bacterium]|nr:SCO1664 family protein [Dehalococcoidia bacterium]
MTTSMADLRNAWGPDDPFVLEALRDSHVQQLQLIYDSSNYVFVATLEHPEFGSGLGIYKPRSGEQPLHDFPYGTLHEREIAAYEASEAFGWRLVPPTVERDGPQGIGSMQLFIAHDPQQHYFELRKDVAYHEQLIRLAVFDLVMNNADRKGGHVLLDALGHVWGIDNALCFHHVDKLRTVIWDFAGVEVSEAVRADLGRMRDCLEARDGSTKALRDWIAEAEVDAIVRRCDALLGHPVLPEMYPWRCVPWPLL